jgi:hypothetical protein
MRKNITRENPKYHIVVTPNDDGPARHFYTDDYFLDGGCLRIQIANYVTGETLLFIPLHQINAFTVDSCGDGIREADK